MSGSNRAGGAAVLASLLLASLASRGRSALAKRPVRSYREPFNAGRNAAKRARRAAWREARLQAVRDAGGAKVPKLKRLGAGVRP